MPITEFEDRWLSAVGVGRATYGSMLTASPATDSGRRFADPDRMEPNLAEFRARHAVRQALGQLIGEGVVARGEGDHYQVPHENISVAYPGETDSVSVFVPSPVLSDPSTTRRFLALRPTPADAGNEVLLPIEELLAGLDHILGARCATLARESRCALALGLMAWGERGLRGGARDLWIDPRPGPR